MEAMLSAQKMAIPASENKESIGGATRNNGMVWPGTTGF
jgi:hypothetical protein